MFKSPVGLVRSATHPHGVTQNCLRKTCTTCPGIEPGEFSGRALYPADQPVLHVPIALCPSSSVLVCKGHEVASIDDPFSIHCSSVTSAPPTYVARACKRIYMSKCCAQMHAVASSVDLDMFTVAL